MSCLDLTTYDTAKHHILTRTRLEDNYVTHGLSRLGFNFIIPSHICELFTVAVLDC